MARDVAAVNEVKELFTLADILPSSLEISEQEIKEKIAKKDTSNLNTQNNFGIVVHQQDSSCYENMQHHH